MDSILKNWKSVSSYLTKCLDSTWLQALGKKSRFVQRSTSQLNGENFLMLNVFNSFIGDQSLNDSCDWLEEHYGIRMSKQSLDERYNTYAVAFMKACFKQVLVELNANAVSKLPNLPFSCIQITDASSIKLPSNLSTFYKGYKGNGGEAMIKLHLNYDLQSGGVTDIALGDGSSHDNKYEFGADEQVQEQGLYLRDLGYYGIDYFKKLDQLGAYYLSRAKSNATFYNKDEQGNYKRINLANHLPALGERKELMGLYMGSQKKLAVRLILEGVPQAVAEQRLTKLKTYANKQKDKRVSDHRKAMCHYNLFITNVPSTKIATDQVRAVYSLRWQVELMFKIWKSTYKVDKFQKMNIFRFECYLYARLIAVLLNCGIQNLVHHTFMQELGQELSPLKAAKYIKKDTLA